ncbi:cytochrome C [Sulfurovum lithotrophicum]|uniref:Cytochrome C n=1 Tax=Sulfurovum lithotrophicum TaxID=206403 RepID=A0A7U4RQ72_9BACT|nr:c-type cytochrome [Sulfurovum lithotrophicum]AKF24446.1 cytochrome C [Sulfurovum lithotrophicum]
MKKKILLGLFLNLILHAETMSEVYLKNGCHGCHGLYGEGIGATPRLQGQREEVLLKKLKDLQNGKTRTAFGNVMISFAKNLDENQTLEMAKYLSTLKRTEQDEVYELDYDDNAGDGSS